MFDSKNNQIIITSVASVKHIIVAGVPFIDSDKIKLRQKEEADKRLHNVIGERERCYR